MLLKETTKQIRKDLKSTFPNCKFSVRIEPTGSMCSQITVSLVSAPFNPVSVPMLNGYAQLNRHMLTKHLPKNGKCNGATLTEQAWAMFRDTIAIVANYYEFGKYSQYLGIEIGKWNKPFKVKENQNE